MPWWFYVLAVLWSLPLVYFGLLALKVWRDERRESAPCPPAHLGVNFRAAEDCDMPAGHAVQRINPRRTGR